MAFEMLLDRMVEVGLVKAGGRQRTDATHVVAAVRDLNRLEMVGETLRAALEALAAAAPQWLTRHISSTMINRYVARIDEWRLPNDQAKRHKLGVQIGTDGFRILKAVVDRRAPQWLREIPAVDVLRRVWIQQYTIGGTGREVIWRDAEEHGFPPGRTRIISPYDTDARHSAKRGMRWTGYKVHLSETCDNVADISRTRDGNPDPARPPNLITNVVTTHAAVADQAMTMPIHHQFAARDLLPAEHLMDAGYPATASLLACRADGVRLVAPIRRDSSRHTREGSPYARDAFTIDFDRQQATCPEGHRSATWNPGHHDGHDMITISFPLSACLGCKARPQCTTSQQSRRQITVRPRHLHDALQQARAEQSTDAWKDAYRARAGIEGTIGQTVAVTGIRHARYTGIGKVDLEHAFAATAINLIRLNAWWTETPLRRTRITHLNRLNYTLAA